uniref:Uncharacterized protein n=1 Tax=Setaria italica TaxID=4555 RepID=K3XTX4_SETIT
MLLVALKGDVNQLLRPFASLASTQKNSLKLSQNRKKKLVPILSIKIRGRFVASYTRGGSVEKPSPTSRAHKVQASTSTSPSPPHEPNASPSPVNGRAAPRIPRLHVAAPIRAAPPCRLRAPLGPAAGASPPVRPRVRPHQVHLR